MKKTLPLILLLFASAAHGQLKRIQLHLSGNLPFIASVQTKGTLINASPSAAYQSTTLAPGLKESFEHTVGFNLGGNLDYHVTPRFFISSGLNVARLRFKRSIDVIMSQQDFQASTGFNTPTRVGQPFGVIIPSGDSYNADANPTVFSSKKAGQTSLYYLQMPLLAGTSCIKNKLLIRAGATFSWSMISAEYKTRYSPSEGIREYKDTSNDSFTSLLVAATVNASYLLHKHIAIEASANQYLTPIYKSAARVGGEAKYVVLSLGISYVLPR
jgi:hypothetical protein